MSYLTKTCCWHVQEAAGVNMQSSQRPVFCLFFLSYTIFNTPTKLRQRNEEQFLLFFVFKLLTTQRSRNPSWRSSYSQSSDWCPGMTYWLKRLSFCYICFFHFMLRDCRKQRSSLLEYVHGCKEWYNELFGFALWLNVLVTASLNFQTLTIIPNKSCNRYISTCGRKMVCKGFQ